jgi:hypothetical protein
LLRDVRVDHPSFHHLTHGVDNVSVRRRQRATDVGLERLDENTRRIGLLYPFNIDGLLVKKLQCCQSMPTVD